MGPSWRKSAGEGVVLRLSLGLALCYSVLLRDCHAVSTSPPSSLYPLFLVCQMWKRWSQLTRTTWAITLFLSVFVRHVTTVTRTLLTQPATVAIMGTTYPSTGLFCRVVSHLCPQGGKRHQLRSLHPPYSNALYVISRCPAHAGCISTTWSWRMLPTDRALFLTSSLVTVWAGTSAVIEGFSGACTWHFLGWREDKGPLWFFISCQVPVGMWSWSSREKAQQCGELPSWESYLKRWGRKWVWKEEGSGFQG